MSLVNSRETVEDKLEEEEKREHGLFLINTS